MRFARPSHGRESHDVGVSSAGAHSGAGDGPIHECKASDRAFLWIMPSIQLCSYPTAVIRVRQRLDHGGVVEVALIEGREGEGLLSQSLEMHIGDSRAVLAHHCRNVAAGCRKMRRIGTDVDRGPGG